MARVCLPSPANRVLGLERRRLVSCGSCLVLLLCLLAVCFVAIPLYYSAVVSKGKLLSSDLSLLHSALQHRSLNQGICSLPKVKTEGEGESYLYHASE